MNDRHASNDALSARLRDAGEYRGFSEEEVARYLDLSRTEMSRIESSATPLGNAKLRSLAKLYQTNVDSLVGREMKPGWESFPDLDRASADLPAEDRNEILHFARFLWSNIPDEGT